jgi:hypothetical protein
MAYCTLGDVNNLVPQQPFTATSVPTAEMVKQLIDDIAAEIDASLHNMGYIVPITGALSLVLVKNANKWGALGMAQDVRMTAVIQDGSIAGGKNVWTARYCDWKKALLDSKNPYELPDAVRTETAVVKPLSGLQSSTTTGVTDYDYLTNAPFRIGMKL